MTDSRVIGREPCPDCGSRDNLTRYSDGHAYCFGMGCGRYEPAEGEYQPTAKGTPMADLLDVTIPPALKARKLNEDTCELFGYGLAAFKNQKVQVATYRDTSGSPVGQKIRFADKAEGMPWLGSSKEAVLFGQHIWRNKGKRLIITEGELDAMSMSQAMGNKWPVVSLINGASGAARDLRNNLHFIAGFEEVVLMFDNDEAGREAAQEAAAVIPAGRCKIASLPLKDASDMLKAGRVDELVQATWNAKSWSPDGIVSVDDIAEEAMKPIEWGLPWVYEPLTKLTYGRRYGEIYAVGAGTGIGKTDFLTEQIAYDITTLGQTVGVLMLEQKPTETVKRLAGKVMGKRFHVPDAGWTEEELREGITKLSGKAHFYDSFGETEWTAVEQQIRFMVTSLGHRIIYLDHLTAMADSSDERASLETIMKEMAGLASELDCMIIFVSHLATPDGKPHEEGGRVTIRHFKGSRAIGFWSYFMFGLERDQQAEDEDERKTTTFRVLKDRYTGQATGKTFDLTYDEAQGRLVVKPEGHFGEDEFADETTGDIPF